MNDSPELNPYANFIIGCWLLGSFTAIMGLSIVLGGAGFLLGISIAAFVCALLEVIATKNKPIPAPTPQNAPAPSSGP